MKEATAKLPDVPLVRSISSTFASNLAGLALGFVSSIILNRSLGPEGKGLYAALLTTSQLVLMVAGLGMSKSVIHYLASRDLPQQAVFRNFISLSGLAMMLGAAILFGLALAEVGRVSFSEGRVYVVTVLLVFSVAHGTGLAALRGLKKFSTCNGLTLLTSAAFVGLVLVLAATDAITPHLALLAKAFASAIVLLIVWSKLAALGFHFRPLADRAILRPIVAYGMGFFFYHLLQNLNYRFDLLLVTHLTTLADTGWYSTGTGLSEIIWYFPNAVGAVLFPVASGMAGREADLLMAKTCRWALLVMSLGVAGLVLIAPWAVTWLYGESFLPAVKVIQALSLGTITNGMFQILGIHLAARKRLLTLTWVAAAGFALNVLLNLWLIPRHGIVGAALSSSASYTVTGALTAWMFLRLSGLRWTELFVIPRAEMQQVRDRVLQKLRFAGPS